MHTKTEAVRELAATDEDKGFAHIATDETVSPSGSLIMGPSTRNQRRQLKAISRRLTRAVTKGNFTAARAHFKAYQTLTGDYEESD